MVPCSCEMVWSSHAAWTLLAFVVSRTVPTGDSRDVRTYKGSMTYREVNISAQGEHTNAKTADDHLWHRYKRNWTGAHYTDFFFFPPQKIMEH